MICVPAMLTPDARKVDGGWTVVLSGGLLFAMHGGFVLTGVSWTAVLHGSLLFAMHGSFVLTGVSWTAVLHGGLLFAMHGGLTGA